MRKNVGVSYLRPIDNRCLSALRSDLGLFPIGDWRHPSHLSFTCHRGPIHCMWCHDWHVLQAQTKLGARKSHARCHRSYPATLAFRSRSGASPTGHRSCRWV